MDIEEIKKRVLAEAGKPFGERTRTLQILFPEFFEPEPVKLGRDDMELRAKLGSFEEMGAYLGVDSVPFKFKGCSVFIDRYRMQLNELPDGRQYLVFYEKKK